VPRILIIAYGNPLRGDDGVAWRAAELLSQAGLPPGVEILTCHQLTPELAPAVSEAAGVLFVDAARSGPPGEVMTAAIEPQAQPSSFTHEFFPASILQLARELYGRAPQAFAVSLCGRCFDHGEDLSPEASAGLPGLVEAVRKMSGDLASGGAESCSTWNIVW